MGIFDGISTPRWMSPDESVLSHDRVAESAASSVIAGMQYGLQKQASADQHQEAVLKMANQALDLDAKKLLQNNAIEDLGRWQSAATDFMSKSPEEQLSYPDPVFKTPEGQSKWLSFRSNQTVKGANALAATTILNDQASFLAGFKKIGEADRAALIEARKFRSDPNIASPQEWELLDAATAKEEAKQQKMKMDLAAVRPTIAGQYGLERTQLNNEGRTAAADERGWWAMQRQQVSSATMEKIAAMKNLVVTDKAGKIYPEEEFVSHNLSAVMKSEGKSEAQAAATLSATYDRIKAKREAKNGVDKSQPVSQGSTNAELENARNAIKMGASAAAVKERYKQATGQDYPE